MDMLIISLNNYKGQYCFSSEISPNSPRDSIVRSRKVKSFTLGMMILIVTEQKIVEIFGKHACTREILWPPMGT